MAEKGGVMRERPILFSGPMVNAIRQDRKTQTRRLINDCPSTFPGWWRYMHWASLEHFKKGAFPFCPYGQPGDRLWVRETCKLTSHGMPISEGWGGTIIEYKDGNKKDIPNKYPTGMNDKWRPSIHMPRWASRITLEIVSRRAERLQDVSEEDAENEGALFWWNSLSFPEQCEKYNGGIGPLAAFKMLWESINGSGSWELNPLVWAVEFKKL